MNYFEKDQKRLKKLWEDVLSASEDDFSPDVSEYEPSDSELSSSEEDPETPRKRIRISKSSEKRSQSPVAENVPTSSVKREVFLEDPGTSSQLPKISTPVSNIDEVIEEVIQQYMDYNDETLINEPASNTVNDVFSWFDVTGMSINKFQ